MGPGHDSSVLHFFQTEWTRAKEYLACPPDRPLVLIAQSANETDVLDQKYGYEFEDILNVDLRRCGQFPAVQGPRFGPELEATRYEASAEDRDPDEPATSPFATVLYFVSVLLFAVAAAFLPQIRRR